MISNFQLITSVGTFDYADNGPRLEKFALIYAENGRGKTTLSSIFRSLANNNPVLVTERRRLGVENDPHIVIASDAGEDFIFEDGAWSCSNPNIAIFDDHFVAENICSGISVEPGHRKNLHEFIIGSEGVHLNEELQGHINRVEQHNRDLRTKKEAIPQSALHGLSVDDFCALENQDDIAQKIASAERALAAARDFDSVRTRPVFETITLPDIDLTHIGNVLGKGLPGLEVEVTDRVQEHFAKIGNGGENWVSDGIGRIAGASQNQEGSACPFCAQDLQGAALIRHYQAYFGDAYKGLKEEVLASAHNFSTSHSSEAQVNFERTLSRAVNLQQFWARFTEIPEIGLDAAPIVAAWQAAVKAVTGLLERKQSEPLEALIIDAAVDAAVQTYLQLRNQIRALSDTLIAANERISEVKESVEGADVAALEANLNLIQATQMRHNEENTRLCEDYTQEVQAKSEAENHRNRVRADLEEYRARILLEYQESINRYLERFGAGFRLAGIEPRNTRSGSTCDYMISINDQQVSLAPEEGERSFKNTLSSGDRNALALAFFFASIDKDDDASRGQKIVVIDDPMTSLDEHRRLTTIQAIRTISESVAQVIALSHSRFFLCELWEGRNRERSSACQIVRAGNNSSVLMDWDVREACITEHDKRHELVSAYVASSVGINSREVAKALRPILEQYIRVSYPEHFQPGGQLGQFARNCRALVITPQAILSQGDLTELDSLKEYANQFHHDTNPDHQAAVPNDVALVSHARRTLEFIKRPWP